MTGTAVERFADRMHEVQRLAEQQIRRLNASDLPIQQSFLFREGKFFGVRWSCENCLVEWAFGNDLISVLKNDQPIAKIAISPSSLRRAA